MTAARAPHPKTESLAAPLNWFELDRSAHSVQFYLDEGFMLDCLSRFISSALGAGDSALIIAPPAHRNGLTERLNQRGVNLAAAEEMGRYVSLDAAQVLSQLMVDGKMNKERFNELVREVVLPLKAAAGGDPRLLAGCGQMVQLLWAEGKVEAAVELERFWNELAGQGSYYFRCVFPIASFSDPRHSELFLKLCAQHTSVIPTESYSALPTEEERLRHVAYLQHREQTTI